MTADYAFMGKKDAENTLPILVLKDCSTNGYAATVVAAKGVDAYPIAFEQGFLKELWYKKFNEPALLAL